MLRHPSFRQLGLSLRCRMPGQLARTYATVIDTSAAPGPEQAAPTDSETKGPVLRTYKPRTPGLRHLKRPINDHLWKGRPYKPLTYPKRGHSKGGRNNTGQITVRHRGGGAKRRIRIVDFCRWRPGPHVVERIEHDPGRSAHIALVSDLATGKKTYILAPDGMRAGDIVQSYRAGLPQDLIDSMGGIIDPGILASKTAWRGNCLPLHMVPAGTQVFNIGSNPDLGGVFCRSAGTFGVVVSKEEETRADGTKVVVGKHVHVKLQSGEVRKVSKDACCTIGVASNVHYNERSLGKAGRSRWLNIRPTVRGVAMNKVDHPHGGGRGKSKGNRIPTSPWGKLTKSGWKTRRTHKSNKMIVIPRERNKGRKKKEQGGK